MAYSFLASSTGTAGNGATTAAAGVTLTKPAAIVNSTLMIVHAYIEPSTDSWTVPAGWLSATAQPNTPDLNIQVFYKVANNEPANWTWFPASDATWATLLISGYSGKQGSDATNRLDTQAGNQADAAPLASQLAPTIITRADGDLVIFGYGNFGGFDPTALTGFATNIRVSLGGTCIADAVKSPAGATGTTVVSAGSSASENFAAMHIGFLLSNMGSVSRISRPFPFTPGSPPSSNSPYR